MAHKTGNYYQRLRRNNGKIEKSTKDNYDYSNLNKIKSGVNKYSQSRVSRSIIINNNPKESPGVDPGKTSTQNKNQVYIGAGYSQKAELQNDGQVLKKSPQKSFRDYSTGIMRHNQEYSLTASKDNIYEKSK